MQTFIFPSREKIFCHCYAVKKLLYLIAIN